MKILIADDHTLFREGVRYLLSQLAGAVTVIESGDYNSAQAMFEAHTDFDLALIDLHMPGRDRRNALEDLIRHARRVPCVVLSADLDVREVRRAMDAGAMGYIPKNESTPVMLGALRLVLSGGIYLPRSIVAGNVPPPREGVELSPRQRDVLREMLRGNSNEAIGERLGLALSTVKAHVTAILKILGVDSRTQAVIAARRMGLMDE